MERVTIEEKIEIGMGMSRMNGEGDKIGMGMSRMNYTEGERQ